MDSPIPWEVIARLQSKSNPRTTHPRSLGREEAFEGILEDLFDQRILPEAEVIERRFDYLCANRATKYRRRVHLRRVWSSQQRPGIPDSSQKLATHELVERLRKVVQAADYCCLLQLAEGHSYADVAARHSLNEGNLKSRVCRARARARKVLTER
jgi:hypothetical protein